MSEPTKIGVCNRCQAIWVHSPRPAPVVAIDELETMLKTNTLVDEGADLENLGSVFEYPETEPIRESCNFCRGDLEYVDP